MTTLAINGGTSAITEPLRPWRQHGAAEWSVVAKLMTEVSQGYAGLSGYLAGIHNAGRLVSRLEEEWAAKFKVKHAIACNSGTSGLLAASAAVSRRLTVFAVPALSMSATEYAPKFIGHSIRRFDVDPWFCAVPSPAYPFCGAAIVTDLFGHPAQIDKWADTGLKIIEDAAQAVLATEHGHYAGTTGDIGVFSLNYHKQLSAGEGGVIVTNDDDFAIQMRDIINHGENREGGPHSHGGLNLRMTELTAAVALKQLERADDLVESRRLLRRELYGLIPPPFMPLRDRDGCTSACYCMPIMVEKAKRDHVAMMLRAEGMPINAGYAHGPVYRSFHAHTPRAEEMNRQLLLIELCSIDPNRKQLKMIGAAFEKVAEFMRSLNG